MNYISKDQNRADQTTIYWFENEESEVYGISDCNGETTAIDCDGCPVDYNEVLKNKILESCVITDEMIAE